MRMKTVSCTGKGKSDEILRFGSVRILLVEGEQSDQQPITMALSEPVKLAHEAAADCLATLGVIRGMAGNDKKDKKKEDKMLACKCLRCNCIHGWTDHPLVVKVTRRIRYTMEEVWYCPGCGREHRTTDGTMFGQWRKLWKEVNPDEEIDLGEGDEGGY